VLQHIYICRHFFFSLDRSNAPDLQSHDLSQYVHLHFYNHLCAATTVFLSGQNISGDHPAVEILHDLETMAYHDYVNEKSSDYILNLAQCIITAILRWANMLNCHLKGVTVSVSDADLMERVYHLTNKIYRETLCIKSLDSEKMMDIIRLDYVQVSSSSWTSHHGIVLSWDLLSWLSVEGGIPCSFTKFITTPDLSGPLYITPDIYHTQITEYSLKTVFLNNDSRPSSLSRSVKLDWSFREHLPRALPTELIFNLLQSIRPVCLSRDCTPRDMLDTLEIIIKWLQGLDSERPSDLYERFKDEILQYKKYSINFD